MPLQNPQPATFFRYFPVMSEVFPFGLHVLSCGYSRLPPQSPYPPVQHPQEYAFSAGRRLLNEYQIIYITGGRGVFTCDETGAVPVKTGDVIILFPDVPHRYHPDKKTGWDEQWVAFSGTQADALMTAAALSPRRPLLHLGLNPTLLGFYTAINECAQSLRVGYAAMLSALTQTILVQLYYLQQNQANADQVSKRIEEACCYMHEHPCETVDIGELADTLGLGSRWFHKRFKDLMGISPLQYHIHCRLSHASELLAATELPIQEIALRLGFRSSYYFSRLFRAKYKLSPSDYRRTSRAHGEVFNAGDSLRPANETV